VNSEAPARAFFRPLDALLIAAVAAVSCWSFLTFRISQGPRVVVYVSNKKFAWYELAGEKREVAVPTRIGAVRLEIGGGAARVISAPCRLQLCVKAGEIRHAHEEIACVPAQMLMILEGEPGSGPHGIGTDAITF
jgi:hypothetical protein